MASSGVHEDNDKAAAAGGCCCCCGGGGGSFVVVRGVVIGGVVFRVGVVDASTGLGRGVVGTLVVGSRLLRLGDAASK